MIHIVPAIDQDFEHFRTLRKSVMKPHVVNQGLVWDDQQEDDYHIKLFSDPGLCKLLHDGNGVGYIGIVENDSIYLDRFCIAKSYQGLGIGTIVLNVVLDNAKNKCKDVLLDVLRTNPVRSLYERLGFVLQKEDEKLAYYKWSAN